MTTEPVKLTARSTSGEVLMHHPRREHYDRIVLNLDKTWFGMAGPISIDAQDRVILRRHLREHYPELARIIRLADLDFDQLTALVDRLAKGE